MWFATEAYGLSTYDFIVAVVFVLVGDARARKLYAAFPIIVRPYSAWGRTHAWSQS